MAEAAHLARGKAETKTDRKLAVRLLAASAIAIAGTIVCYALMLRTSLGQRFDYSAHIGSFPVNPAVLGGDAMRGIAPYVLVVVIVVLVVIGFARHRPLLGIGGAVAAGIAVLVADVLKDEILTRPFLTHEVPRAANTFPSGHAVAAMVAAIALVLVVPARWRISVAVVAGAYGWLTAVQQQTTSSHYPSDVIGALMLAFAAVAGVAGVLAWFRPVRSTRIPYYAPTQAVLGAAGAIAAGLSIWGVIKVLVHLGSHPIPAPAAAINYDAFLTGIALSMAVGIGVVISFLALLADAEIG